MMSAQAGVAADASDIALSGATPSPAQGVTPVAADLYGDAWTPQVPRWQRRRRHLAGLVTVLVAALAAHSLSLAYGAPLTLASLLIGLALSFLASDARLGPGLEFAATRLLRAAIVLTGTQVSLARVTALGWGALIAVPTIMLVVIAIALIAARLLRMDRAFATLCGAAVAICGLSAIAGVASVLPRQRLSDAQIAVAIVCVSAFSAGAMITYPLLCRLLDLSELQAGFLLGASIHDVSQTMGAGYSLSHDTGEFAILVKLARVALLGPVMALVAILFAKSGEGGGSWQMPWFLLGFVALATLASLGWLPLVLIQWSGRFSIGLLAMAITATAMRAPVAQIVLLGWRPVALIFAASAAALIAALIAAATVIG